MTEDRHENDIAEAFADVRLRRTRGEAPDVLSYRDQLGASHAEFVDLMEVEAMLDEIIEPPLPERLPRDFGDYKLLRQLGRGAIGVVYEAVHRTIGKKRAVKVLRSGFDADPQARERFRREAFATAQVRHDHIVEIFEASEVEGSPFYAMSLVEGRSLASLVKAREVPPVKELCREMAGVADALHALHTAESPVIHRDVKPSNIMVRPDGRMILADFGLARASDGLALTKSGDALGTPLYMSPEQMLGRRDEIDARADVYALGATHYEAIAGRPVFAATEMAALAKQVVAERAEPLRHVAPHCPVEVEHIVMKALEKDKADRYKSAAAMRDDLKAFGEGRAKDVVGKPVGSLLRAFRWGRTPTGLSIAAGALLAVGAAVWYTHRPATLDLTSLPDHVEVIVAGQSWGTTPLRKELSAGTYNLTLRSEGFTDREKRVDLAPGATREIELPMVPKDLDDPVARTKLASALGVGRLAYNAPSNQRGSSEAIVLVAPRGDVRLEDIRQYVVETNLMLLDPSAGKLEFRRGTETLWSGELPAKSGAFDVPSTALSQIQAGDTITWGFFSPKKRGTGYATTKDPLTTFRVVAADPSQDVAALRHRLGDVPEQVAGEFEVRLLLSKGMATAARVRADALADANPKSLLLQVVARKVYEALKIQESDRVTELNARIARFPEADRKRLDEVTFGTAGGTTPGR